MVSACQSKKSYLLPGRDKQDIDLGYVHTLNGTTITQADYEPQDLKHVNLINTEGAKLAKRVCAEWTAKTPNKPRFVAGAIGPTNRTLSVSPSVENPEYRNCTYDEVVRAYLEQAEGLYAGGVDLFLVETIFDSLNAKAAMYALDLFFEKVGKRIPVFISGTIVDNSGRTLSGQTNEAFRNSIRHAKPLAIGLNGALDAKDMIPYISNLSKCADCFVFCYPNEMAEDCRPFAELGLINGIGGCCGTTNEHIKALHDMVSQYKPRKASSLRCTSPV
ncbi:methionine synthase [Pseudoscourfieldia marina]